MGKTRKKKEKQSAREWVRRQTQTGDETLLAPSVCDMRHSDTLHYMDSPSPNSRSSPHYGGLRPRVGTWNSIQACQFT